MLSANPSSPHPGKQIPHSSRILSVSRQASIPVSRCRRYSAAVSSGWRIYRAKSAASLPREASWLSSPKRSYRLPALSQKDRSNIRDTGKKVTVPLSPRISLGDRVWETLDQLRRQLPQP